MQKMKPMEPVATETIDTTGDYLFQVKWDGIRILADKSGGQVTMYTRSGHDETFRYPELTVDIGHISADDFLLDGELIALGENGLPDFQKLLQRHRSKAKRQDISVGYMVFDCLSANGKDICAEPIERRQDILQSLLNNRPNGRLALCENYANGVELFAFMEKSGMEGIVAKRKGSPYYPGKKLNLWQKTKCWRQIRVTAEAVKYRNGAPASLQIVRSIAGQTECIGSVSSGLNQKTWAYILSQVNSSPTANGIAPLKQGIDLSVQYLEWTKGGHLRMPKVIEFLGPSNT